jgi:hypothetical protein
MKKKIKSVTKKKVLKKGSNTASTNINTPQVSSLPLGTKNGKTVLKRGIQYPSGVSEARKIEAFLTVLYVNGKKLTIRIKDLYVALMNRVRPFCNMYDLLPYESSTNDPSIRKKLEYCMGNLRRKGYLSPVNSDGTVTLLKVIPPGLKLSK